MSLPVDVEQLRDVDVSVSLCRRETHVPKQLLNRAQIGPRLQEMRGKGMAQRVWADSASRAAARNASRHQPLNASACQSSTPRVDKERLALWCPSPVRVVSGEQGSIGVPLAQRLLSRFVERHDSLFASFAHHAHHPTREIDILQIECNELAQADAGGVEQLEDGPDAAGTRRCRS